MISMAPAQDRTAQIVRDPIVDTGHRAWFASALSYPRRFPEKRSAVLSLSGRSERASNLPLCLHKNPSPGCFPVMTLQDSASFPPRSRFLREISWPPPVPKEFFPVFHL